ncbi:MAG TPA: Mpo1-like protein [Candidatus Obscuribacterales bacterium]
MSEFRQLLQESKAHFVASHQNPINQALHHLTNILAIAAVILLFYDWRLTLVCLVLTQVFALGGHAVFEKNHPAFVKYPGITILSSMTWSFENWFGLRQLLAYLQRKTA